MTAVYWAGSGAAGGYFGGLTLYPRQGCFCSPPSCPVCFLGPKSASYKLDYLTPCFSPSWFLPCFQFSSTQDLCIGCAFLLNCEFLEDSFLKGAKRGVVLPLAVFTHFISDISSANICNNCNSLSVCDLSYFVSVSSAGAVVSNLVHSHLWLLKLSKIK